MLGFGQRAGDPRFTTGAEVAMEMTMAMKKMVPFLTVV